VCEINKDAWLGSKFIKMESKKPETGRLCVYSRQNKNSYCMKCQGEAKKCYKLVGNSFIDPSDGNPKARFDGERYHILWPATDVRGILMEPDACPKIVPGCDLKFDGLEGKTFRTWDSKDMDKKTVEIGTYQRNSEG